MVMFYHINQRFIRLVFILCFFCLQAVAQTPNPCGVTAAISPSAADAVVPVDTIIFFTSTSVNATSVKWLYDGVPSGITGPGWNYQVTAGVHRIGLVAYNGNCSDTTTVVYFSPGTAHNVDSLLMADYGTYAFNEEATSIDNTSDGGFIMGGVQYQYNGCETGVIVKIRDKGCIDWSRKFHSPYYCNNSKVTTVLATADTNYYAATNGNELARLDKNGNLVWNKRFAADGLGLLNMSLLTGDPQGAVYTISQGFYFNGWTITKLDRNGAVTWNKFFRLSYDLGYGTGQSEFAMPSGMIWLNDKIYICGNAYSKTNDTYFSFLTKLDAITGAKEWQYGYTDPEFPGAMGFMHLALYDTLVMASSGAQGQMVTLIDQQGQVRKSIKTKFATSYGPRVSRAGADSNGHIYMMQWTEETLPLQPYYWFATNFAEIDTALNKYWGMVFAQYNRGYFSDAVMGTDNKFGATGQDFGYVDDGRYGSRDFRFLKVDTVTSGQTCFYSDNGYSIAEKVINRLQFQYLIDSSFHIVPANDSAYTLADGLIQSRYTCPDYIDSCSFMKISGPANLCNFSGTYTYRLHRNRKCSLAPQWQLPAGVSISGQTDSTLTVRFPGFGVYTLTASLKSCIPVKDSLVITVVSKSHPLNIGRDTTICAGTGITLHASADFLAYTWTGGSTDSVLNVTQPGIYWVETIDSCNNHQRDSITISPYSNGIDIGPDRVACAGDTLHISAPGGFLQYEWPGNYNIVVSDPQHVVVYPATDTAYFIKAEKLPGCFAYDTVRVKVNRAPAIQLGPDTSFCLGDSTVFNAGTGFTQYRWSNGSQAQKITVHTAGYYSVTGTAANGCNNYDTIQVVKVWANPLVNLADSPALCTGSKRTLDAGLFAAYRWQDGSTASSFTVNSTGTYYVTVTDTNYCKGSDTVRILRMLPVPAGFLPADTAICSYGDIKLYPNQTYAAYLWNNGATTGTITITVPGQYSLRVTDRYGCTGYDSVLVFPKQCLKGFYMPTAFSPNADIKNDILKPLLFGNLVKFEWVIYNRYGQIIFTTADPLVGWDGTFKGMPQNAGTYVWICRYRFSGENEQVKNGSVVLLR